MRSVGAIILAAGGSTRLGQAKQLLRFNGESLVRRAVRAAGAGGCSSIAVIVGAKSESIEEEVRDLAADVVANPDWERGLGTSIKAGVHHLLRSQPGLKSVVILACDQPLLDAQIVRSLLDADDRTAHPIVACSYANTLGIPALFARSCFEALLQLPDDSGAKPLIEADSSQVARVEFEGGALDIDTPADLARLQQLE